MPGPIKEGVSTAAIFEYLQWYKDKNAHSVPDPKAEKNSYYLRDYLGQPPFLSASSWAIYDCRRGKLIAGKNDTTRREVASITKVMTFYTAI